MTSKIVHTSDPVTLVGGGILTQSTLDAALALAPRLVAADGGADQALAFGHVPEAVIGDLDSLSPAAQQTLPGGSIHNIAEQDTTDFDKALRMISTPVVLAVGFLGGRVDHQLAALHVLAQGHDSPCILLGETEVIFHLTHPVSLSTKAGEVVSLFPLQPVRGQSTGLEWPIDDLELSPMGQIGTSNRALGPITLTPNGAGLLAIVPRRLLGELVAALKQ
ncbi:thiamine pyrophosphokinase [Tritonibacter multivorans]|uniref:Thiamine diphosphokinase n=1 Tax=Tritonibacter multivorans TaxID=928856 RepID=A0A0P1G8K4_9RHOB|nr:thiamine diphosphokinase [Tritonibacter multivorans]MDA7421761.1 thiamine diphosphokinase [Tritonibacter multivorans]CUH77950.1 thiamine pyrophosphokinase [Tritonibacter multivorans]SFD04848.1 thiamine pyrophosphokinase [Tritonibacter multivorans]